MRFLVCYSWFWSVAYGPMHGAVVLHRVPSCRTRNKQTGVQRDLIAMSSCSFPAPHWLASLQCVARPQEPERQSELVSILKDHSVLNRFRCHNPHCTNATHCKKHLSVHPSVVTYFRVVQYKWSSPLLILLKQEERTHKKKKNHKRPQTPWDHGPFHTVSWLAILLSRRSSLSWDLLE